MIMHRYLSTRPRSALSTTWAYADQGCHKDAEMMYNRVLAGYENAWEPEHTSTLG
jgi:hypothetical protein